MCRLYGFRATHPTRVESELIEAQNSLMRQSLRDGRGMGNPDGWGLGTVRDGVVHCEREVGPAYESEEYRRDAARVDATTVLGHVRRATVGEAREENTHPFRREGSMLAHNGHVPAFERVRPRILEETSPELERGIRGSTDSEHVFHLLLSRLRERVDAAPDRPVAETGPGGEVMQEVLAETIVDLREWCSAALEERDAEGGEGVPRSPEGRRLDRLALNVLWTVDDEMAGSRFGRSLWCVEREGGRSEQVHPDPVPDGYRSVTIASERITGEGWREVPESSVFRVDEDFRVRARPL